jgi:hypothetical protein
MTVTFDLPRSFQPADYLPARLLTRADDANWLVSTIVRKIAARDTDPWGCARLHSDVLRRIMYSPTQPAVVKALEDSGVIEVAPYYAGVKTKGYRMARRFLGDRSIQVSATDVRLIERIERERQRQQADEQRIRWLPIHYALDHEQRAVTITDDAEEILEGLPDHTRLCQHVLVSRIQRRELPFSVSSTGRCFNSLTGLKRELRAAVRLAGKPMGSVDVANAQPALLALMLSPKYPPNGPKKLSTYKHRAVEGAPCLPPPCLSLLPAPDASDFSLLARRGCLYERLLIDSGADCRDAVKLALLRDVLAKRGRYPSVVEDAFRAAFPTVYRIIRAVNREDHGTLVRLLQRAESWLVVERVAPRLLGKVPFVTLHDAIFSQRRDVREVAGAFREVFGELGFEMVLK